MYNLIIFFIKVKEPIIYNNIFVPDFLVNEYYEDRYFDADNAIEEAKFIYFEGCKISEKISAKDNTNPFVIGETGFGAGRIFIALLDFMDNSSFKNLEIIYNSVELHPLSAERISTMLDNFKDKNGAIIDEFVGLYSSLDIKQKGLQQLVIKRDFGKVILNIWFGEALDMVNNLETLCDAWFLDGHNPKKNPEIWRPELLNLIGQKTNIDGTCASFTVSPIVINALTEAGFKVEQYPGSGWKKSVMRGIKV